MGFDIKYYEDFSFNRLKDYFLFEYCYQKPSIAYANLDQMFIDLLLYNAKLQNQLVKIATIHSSAILPILGSSPFSEMDDPTLCSTTALELFYIPSSQIVILQQRSCPIDRMSLVFASQLMEFVTSLTPSNVIFVSSGDCTFFDMSMMKTNIVYYTSSPIILNQIGESIASMNLVDDQINGSGMLIEYEKYCINAKVHFTSFLAFVNEGENFHDAVTFFKRVNDSCKFIQMDEIIMPPVWYRVNPWLDEDDY